jgi:dGTPase
MSHDAPASGSSSKQPPDGEQLWQYELLAAYAMPSAQSAGRKHPEPTQPFRGPFQRDRDRIVHCSAFRRLSHKTQVFTGEKGDYHRTRLTHTLEVTCVARTLGRALRLNEDLIEALSLAHDLGHPPFGHAGEETLNRCLASVGGFSHNRQGLRIVEELEQRYPGFPGLNLSLETLEGQAARIEERPPRQPLLEVQVVDAADAVAYNTHDADDALEMGLLTIDELLEFPLWQQAAGRVSRQWTALAGKPLTRALVHELIAWQVADLLHQTQARLVQHGIDSLAAVRAAPRLVQLGAELAVMTRDVQQFLYHRVYRHPQILAVRHAAQDRLVQLFDRLVQRPDLLPPGFQGRIAAAGLERTVGDYLAGMTDRYADQQHAQLIASRY